MYSSQNAKNNLILTLYGNNRTVFRLIDIALLTGEQNFQSLNSKINYAVRTDKLLNPRKGLYAKPEYNFEEIAGSIFIPSYISLDYVLQKAGIIFQYDSTITSVCYLSRAIKVDEKDYRFRKIKPGILLNTKGINRQDNHVNIAIPERAFLDMLYLEGDYYFDNINPLRKDIVNMLLPIYRSKALTKRVNKILNHA